MKTSPAITLALSVTLLAGCSAVPGTAELPGSGAPAASPEPAVEQFVTPTPSAAPTAMQVPVASKNPVEVGETFVAAAYTWDTRTNTGLTAALKRVEYMATDELAAQFIAPQNVTEGAAWNRAAKNQAHTEPKVTIVPEGNQALMKTRPGTKKAAYMVTWKWAGPDAYQQGGGKDLVILTLVETQQGWKISSFEPTPFK